MDPLKIIEKWYIRWSLILLLILVAFPAFACQEVYLELGMGYDRGNHYTHDKHVAGLIRLECIHARDFVFKDDYIGTEWDHHSGVFEGWPFSGSDKDTADALIFKYGVRLK